MIARVIKSDPRWEILSAISIKIEILTHLQPKLPFWTKVENLNIFASQTTLHY